MELLLLIYLFVGYISVNELIFSKFSTYGTIQAHLQHMFFKGGIALFFGWITIPIWIIKKILSRNIK